ncbi:MAG: leucine-rich repeat domain-containing protein [Clostridia bacterium]|nr:leucine-rich repeat domain-containing protein [Clostridia bacterium]
MRKRIAAAVVAALMLISCVPFISGCKASIRYTLNEDKASYTVKVTGFAGALGGEVVIPAVYGEGDSAFPVTAIANQGFASTNISKITIPKSVKSVGISAFMYCANLREVVFEGGSGVEAIMNGAFAACENLKSVNIPETVKLIYPMAFMGCASLSSVELPEVLERIGYRAFYQTGLEEIVIPASVHDETVPDLDENGEQKKDEDGKLLTVTYMGIGYGAFHSCERLKLAVVNARVETLYAGVFGYCLALEDVYLPQTLKAIEGAKFSDGKLYYGHAFHHDGALKNVYFEGSEEQWAAIEIDNKEYKDKQISTPFDNSDLIEAEKHFNAIYNKA